MKRYDTASVKLVYSSQPLIVFKYTITNAVGEFHTTSLSLSVFHGWNTVEKAIKSQFILSSIQYKLIPCNTMYRWTWSHTITHEIHAYSSPRPTPHSPSHCSWLQISYQHKGQAALWVTNGCTSVSESMTSLPMPSKPNPSGYMTLKWHQCDVMTTHRCQYDVISTSCACWDRFSSDNQMLFSILL